MLSELQIIALRVIVAVVAAAGGGLVVFFIKNISHRLLCALISLAAGALLSVVVLDVLPETLEMTGLLEGITAIASGYALFYLIGRYVSHVCPACSATHKEAMFQSITILMIVALSIHSFMDGLAICASYQTSATIGILILIAVAYHKFPEGMALTSVARGSGYTRGKALAITISLEGITTAAGGIIGVFALARINPILLGFVLGHVGGGFLYIVFHALLGEMFKHEKKSTLIYTAIGFISLAVIGIALKPVISGV